MLALRQDANTQRVDVPNRTWHDSLPGWRKHLLRVRKPRKRAYEDPKATRTLPDWVGENVTSQVFEEF